MIVVVIIGLLAAMAIPAFQKVRRSSLKSTMANDIKQLASAANQYHLDNSATQVALTQLVNTYTNTNMGFLKELSKGVGCTNTNIDQGGTITLTHPNFGTLTGAVDTGKTFAETNN